MPVHLEARRSEPEPRPRRRMTGEQRREHLIEAALHLFATRGFRGTTTKSIAEAAGVSEGIIFRHFPTKEDLYGAILTHKATQQGNDRTRAALRRCMAAGDDEGVVLQLATKILQSYKSDVDFHRLMLLAALEQHDLARVSHRMLGLPFFDLLRDYVVQRQQAGVFRPGDPTLAVFALVALPMHFAIVNKLFGLEPVKSSDRDVAAEFSRVILDGLRMPAGAPARLNGRTASAGKPSVTSKKAPAQNRTEKEK